MKEKEFCIIPVVSFTSVSLITNSTDYLKTQTIQIEVSEICNKV